jgi:hypothetical protein
MLKERWKDVVGYEGWYQVSSLGRIKRVKQLAGARAGRILKQKSNDRGYLRIALYKYNKKRYYFVHRLVANAFIGLSPKGYQINHKNGIKTDNTPKNLEWVTAKENSIHATYTLGYSLGEKNPNAKLTNSKTLKIKKFLSKRIYKHREIARMFGVSKQIIDRISTKNTWSYLEGE